MQPFVQISEFICPGFNEDNFSSDLIDWCYSLTTKELYQVTKTTSFEDLQQMQKAKWIAHVTRIMIHSRCQLFTVH